MSYVSTLKVTHGRLHVSNFGMCIGHLTAFLGTCFLLMWQWGNTYLHSHIERCLRGKSVIFQICPLYDVNYMLVYLVHPTNLIPYMFFASITFDLCKLSLYLYLINEIHLSGQIQHILKSKLVLFMYICSFQYTCLDDVHLWVFRRKDLCEARINFEVCSYLADLLWPMDPPHQSSMDLWKTVTPFGRQTYFGQWSPHQSSMDLSHYTIWQTHLLWLMDPHHCLSGIHFWKTITPNNFHDRLTPALPPPINHRSMEDHYTVYFWLIDPLSIKHGSLENHYTK